MRGVSTGNSPATICKNGKDSFFHESDGCLFYLLYERNQDFLRASTSALNGDRADRITNQVKAKGKTARVFATHKFIGQKELSNMGITFCQLPFAVEGVV